MFGFGGKKMFKFPFPSPPFLEGEGALPWRREVLKRDKYLFRAMRESERLAGNRAAHYFPSLIESVKSQSELVTHRYKKNFGSILGTFSKKESVLLVCRAILANFFVGHPVLSRKKVSFFVFYRPHFSITWDGNSSASGKFQERGSEVLDYVLVALK